MRMKDIIERGNIVRNEFPGDRTKHVNLYMGSGRCGACFDEFGLMHNGYDNSPLVSKSNTLLMHSDHWHRGIWGFDCWMPVYRLVSPDLVKERPVGYRQELNIFDGTLSTDMKWKELSVSIKTFFSPAQPDFLFMEIVYEAGGDVVIPDIIIEPQVRHSFLYNPELQGEWETIRLQDEDTVWAGRIKAGTAESLLAVKVMDEKDTVRLGISKNGIHIKANSNCGRYFLIIGCAAYIRKEYLLGNIREMSGPGECLNQAVNAWHKRWGASWIDIPVPEYQALWCRSVFYLLSTFSPDVSTPAPPNGWTGNQWPFYFPGDQSFFHPVFLKLGHIDIARAWVENYKKLIPDIRNMTGQLYNKEGARWPHNMPIGSNTRMMYEGSPDIYQYEHSVAGHPVRLAWETSLYMGDRQWALEMAWPVVLETADFFCSVLEKECDGPWSFHMVPSFGMDEFGGCNAKNYLDILYAAEYTLTTAVKMAERFSINEPKVSLWSGILKDKLAFSKLYYAADNLYMTHESRHARLGIGLQKHPVQLIPLIYFPKDELDSAEINAYSNKYSLCLDSTKTWFYGWTLAAFMVAAARMGDRKGLLFDMTQCIPSKHIDTDYIQFYESSGESAYCAYYLTNGGIYAQAMIDAIVNDYFGNVAIGAACPDEWSEVSFANIHTSNGKKVSGQKKGGRWEVKEEYFQGR